MPPTSSDCESIQETYGLTMPVLYDPQGIMQGAPFNYPKNHQHVVMGSGNVVVAADPSDGSLAGFIDDLLGL